MLGAVVLAVIVVILIPVGVIMSGAAGAALLGWALKSDGDARYEGSELIELNR